MTKKEMKTYLMNEYARYHEYMMFYFGKEESQDIKIYHGYWSARNAIGRVLTDMKFMTRDELQAYLDTLNENT